MSKKSIESSMEIPIITEQALEAIKSTRKIYTDKAIWTGTFLGGPLVAGYLIAENFKSFNEIDKAKKTWIFTIIGAIIIFGGAYMIPDYILDKMPKSIIPASYTVVAYVLVRHYQYKNISAFIALGGKTFGWGRVIIISLIGCAITLACIFVLIFRYIPL